MNSQEYIDDVLNELFKFWLQRTSALGAVIFIVLFGLDYINTPENLERFFYYRIVIVSVLIAIALLSKKYSDRNIFFHQILLFLAVIGSAITIELMILRFGGHTSTYYAGMILIGICAIGFIPARFSVHMISASSIYCIYLFPIIATEEITDFRIFFTANIFLISALASALLLRYLNEKRLINELGLNYDTEQNKIHLDEQIKERTFELTNTVSELEDEIAVRIKAEKALQDSEEKYRSLVESTDDSIYMVDKNYKYTFINKTHLSRMGLSNEKVMGKIYSDFHSPQETKEFIEQIDKVSKTGESFRYEHKSERDGRYFLRTISPVKDSRGITKAVTVISKDINELKRLEEKLHVLSMTDELTGLYNRRGFITLAEQQFKMAKRLEKGIVIISSDLDDLKTINDTYGHQEGDLALIDTANILKESFREADIIARIGGDEFVVLLLEDIGYDLDILNVRLQKNLEINNAKRKSDYTLSLSAGITRCEPECGYSINQLLTRADKLMYEQKKYKLES